MSGPDFDDRGQAWTIFFGVAAIVIAVLVLVSRVLAAVDGPSHQELAAASPATMPSAPVVGAAEPADVDGAGASGGQPMGGTAVESSAGGGAAIAAPEATPAVVAPPAASPALEPETISEPAPSRPPAAPTEAPPAEAPPPTPAPAPPPPPPPAPVQQVVAAPVVSAHSVAILERSCGALVYGKSENARVPPASLTKIVTALVAAERITNLNAPVLDTDISARQLVKTTDSSVMGIEPGMTFTLRDLMYGLLLPSGNDAALQLAEYISGGSSAFVGLMNAKAASIGMTNTQFVNPHGLDAPGHFSTALDMAKAGRAFLANPMLAQIAVTASYETPGAVRILMNNGNKLLQTYPGAFGVKIGYTTNAKQTFVAAANRNGRELIVSLMGSDDRYADATALLDWAFATRPSACS